MRPWAAEAGSLEIYHYPSDFRATDETTSGKGGVVLSGHHSERLVDLVALEGESLWVIHPTSSPPLPEDEPWKSDCEVIVVLPEIDETGLNEVWRDWAEQVDGRVVISPGCGIDIRSAWPAVAPGVDPT